MASAKKGRPAIHHIRMEPLEKRLLLAAHPVITEFMASNGTTLDDGDGNSSDWIEVYNPTDRAIDLAGYRLTDKKDNLSRWVFPGIVLPPNDYLVVFASGQDVDDYIDAGGMSYQCLSCVGRAERNDAVCRAASGPKLPGACASITPTSAGPRRFP